MEGCMEISSDELSLEDLWEAGDFFFKKKNFYLAKKFFNEIVECKNNDKNKFYYRSIYNIAWCFFREKEYKKAEEYFLSCADESTDTDLCYRHAAMCSYLRGEYEKSIQHIKKYNTDIGLKDIFTARCLYNLGEYQKSYELYTNHIEYIIENNLKDDSMKYMNMHSVSDSMNMHVFYNNDKDTDGLIDILYPMDFREYKKNKVNVLYITLHPNPGYFWLYKKEFLCDVLFVSLAVSYSYFCFSTSALSKKILKLIDANKYKKIILSGSSKGGTGAILIGALLSNFLKDIDIEVHAFSPQTQIYPINSNILSIPTYKELISISENDPIIRKNLEKFGNLSKIITQSNNIKITIYSGELSEKDMEEANRLKIKNKNKVSINTVLGYPYHNVAELYTGDAKEIDARTQGDNIGFPSNINMSIDEISFIKEEQKCDMRLIYRLMLS